jgi:hypothetical protein
MSSDTVFFLFIFFSLAVIGAKKSWRWFDSGDKVKSAAQDGLAGWFTSIFKK